MAKRARVNDRIAAYALYTDPPLGRAGMTEAEARAAGHAVLVGRMAMEDVARAIEKGETAGLMKLVVDGETRQILGAAILGTGGDEVDPLRPGPDVCRRALHSAAARDAYPSDGRGTAAVAGRGAGTSSLTGAASPDRSGMSDQGVARAVIKGVEHTSPKT